MKKAVWGTGYYAGRFISTYNKKEEIDFFIDSDRKKENQFFLGKKIVHPDSINNWKELYVYVPFNYYEEIASILKMYGLKENIHFEKYERVGYLSNEEAEQDYQRAIYELTEQKENMFQKFLYWGMFWNRKGYKQVLSQLKEQNKEIAMALISEESWLDRRICEVSAGVPTIVAPKVFQQETYVKGNIELLHQHDSAYVEHLQKAFGKTADAVSMIHYMYQYINTATDVLEPKGIFIYGSFTVSHMILEHICEAKNIPIIYTHAGILPGTLVFDTKGEMGESLPTLFSNKFLKLPINDREKEKAGQVWEYLEKGRINRKPQPRNKCIEYIMTKREKNHPIIFFAGQNDVFSHMIPNTDITKKYHSPIFKTSVEAGVYLAGICKKNDWNFVYKPHPMYVQEGIEEILPANTIYVETGDINDIVDASDVVVTILSQTNYVALIRHKPVVMLGYNQIKGKGCTYEAFRKEEIEDAIKEALEKGFTQKQQEAFLVHMAQILKYYLYDDLQERELRFGRSEPLCIEEFYELENLLKRKEDI